VQAWIHLQPIFYYLRKNCKQETNMERSQTMVWSSRRAYASFWDYRWNILVQQCEGDKLWFALSFNI